MRPIYIAMCPHYWGKGETPDEAKRKAREAGARVRVNERKWLVKLMPPGTTEAWVDGMGAICWKGNPDEMPSIVETPRK